MNAGQGTGTGAGLTGARLTGARLTGAGLTGAGLTGAGLTGAGLTGAGQPVDCHCHVFDPARFPYRPDTFYTPSGAEIGTAAQLTRVLDSHRIGRALLVGPNSGYGEDNRCLLDALATNPDRFRGMAVVGNTLPRPELERLAAAGVVGVTLNPTVLGLRHYDDAGNLLRSLADLDLIADVQVEHDLLGALAPSLLDAGVRVVVDHCGRPDPAAGTDQPGFRELLGLARTGRVGVKLSGFAKFSRQPYPHEDTWPYVAALLDAFGPDRCVWASDWPFLRAPYRIDYGPLLALLDHLVPDPGARDEVLAKTPARMFGFATSQ